MIVLKEPIQSEWDEGNSDKKWTIIIHCIYHTERKD